jgi:recombination protein RecT
MIVCTHSHPDHSPGAGRCRPVRARQAAHSGPAVGPHGARGQPVHARPGATKSGATALAGRAEGQITHTLQVIHTPGHAANHLCLVLLEDGLLFSGDHILNGSTTVIDPPDGNMTTTWIRSTRLSAPAPSTAWSSSCPPTAMCWAADGARSHRPAQGAPPGARGQGAGRHAGAARRHAWTTGWRQAYDDVPPRMWPVAQRSLLAHVARTWRSRLPSAATINLG